MWLLSAHDLHSVAAASAAAAAAGLGKSATVPAPVVVAALRGWAFLLSTVPTYQLTAHFVEQHLAVLARLLHSGDVDVRGAAGEGIALMWVMGDLSSLPESPRPSSSRSNGTDMRRQHNSLAALAVGSPPPQASSVLTAAAAAAAAPAAPAAASGASARLQQPDAAAAAGGVAQQQQQGDGSASVDEGQQPQQQEEEEEEDEELQKEDEEEEEEEEVGCIEDIVERMRDLAKNRGDAGRKNKGDRASMRGTFRDLLAIIEVQRAWGWGGLGGPGLWECGVVCAVLRVCL